MLAGNILRYSARRVPNKTAIIFGDQTITYDALDRAANRVANAMVGAGISKSGTAFMMSRNRIEYMEVHYGAARSGSMLGHLWVSYTAREIIYILERADAEMVIVEDVFQDKIAEVRDKLPKLKTVVVIGDVKIADAVSYAEFLAGQNETEPDVRIVDSDPFSLSYTGGTTGFPKGVVGSHQARYIALHTGVIEHSVQENDVVAAATPLFHAIGLLIWVPAGLMVGATVILMQKWDAGEFVSLAEKHGITCSLFVPTQLREVLSDEHFNADKLKALYKVGAGGAPTTPELYQRLMKLIPHAEFTDNYGCTEAGTLCFRKPWHGVETIGSVGRAAVTVELRVADENGDPVKPGEIGEIITRGPHVMEGYLKEPEETKAFFRLGDEWGWTGDLAMVDENGFITLAGRSKDMVVSGGVNIYPREVELVIEAHEGVHDVAAFGVPDEKWGEKMIAYVVPMGDAALDEAALIEFCGKDLSRVKLPKNIVFMDSIPKTPTNKISKVLLRDHYLESQS